MKSENTKLILGLAIGAAIGATVGYFLACDNKQEIIDRIGETVDKAKKKISQVINEGIEELDTAVDKVNTLAQTAISRAKADQMGGEA
ncbi:MAG: YtxH domain-containing protein [Dysgonamonadaceae bacterium]|jgi:gas vesicle protein|nr:YtxH domain-containing protein [Dysgonamonadaceae bacterium]